MITVFVSIIQKEVLKVMLKKCNLSKNETLKYVCEKQNIHLPFQFNKNILTVNFKL